VHGLLSSIKLATTNHFKTETNFHIITSARYMKWLNRSEFLKR